MAFRNQEPIWRFDRHKTVSLRPDAFRSYYSNLQSTQTGEDSLALPSKRFGVATLPGMAGTPSQAVGKVPDAQVSLRPLDGIRAISALLVTLQHICLLFGLASPAWNWYKILDAQYWPNVVQGPLSQLAMVAFFVNTGLLAAVSLVSALEREKAGASHWQIARSYYARRSWRILPAYLASLAIACGILLWLKSSVGGLKDVRAREVARYVISTDPRSIWVDLTLSLNIFRRLGLVPYQWNLASQVQFYVVVPLVLIALKPGPKAGYRSRVFQAAVITVVLSTAFRAFMVWKHQLVVPFSLYALDHFNVAGSSGHDPRHVSMNGHFFYDLHATLPGRANEFALGVLVYLISSQPQIRESLKRRSLACTIGSIMVLAINGLACFSGAKAYEPVAYPSAPAGVCYFVHIFIIGIFNPLSIAWLVLYILVQPDALSRLLAQALSVQPLKFVADVSLSFWMLNWWVIVLMLVLSPSSWGPLSSFATFAKFAAVNVPLTILLAWAQDKVLSQLVDSLRGSKQIKADVKKAP